MSQCKECGFDGWHDRCCSTQFTKPAPSAEAKMVEAEHEEFYRDINVGASTGPYWVKLGRLRALLATQGLAIVPATDLATPEERAELLHALQLQQNSALTMADRFNECKSLLRRCWRNVVTVDTAHAIFDWFKAQGEDLNELHDCAAKEKRNG